MLDTEGDGHGCAGPCDCDALARRSRSFHADLWKLMERRLRKCKSRKEETLELTVQFLHTRAMAEMLAETGIIAEENEPILRDLADAIKRETDRIAGDET